MSNENDLLKIKSRFTDYVAAFYMGESEYDSAIHLKEGHSMNVGREILELSRSIGLQPHDCFLAQIMGILHDIGRFEQFATYRTYRDSASEDHAALGVRVLEKSVMLDDYVPQDRELIKAVIAHHNRATIPDQGEERFLLFLKLVRDADKIDILRLATQHYCGCHSNQVIELGTADTPEISDAIAKCLMRRQIARITDVKTLSDFKMLQIGWIFDLHFPRTFRVIKERGYLEKISRTLPQTNEVIRAVSAARLHLEMFFDPEKRLKKHEFRQGRRNKSV